MIYVVICILFIIIAWLSYEFHRAPLLDDDGNVIKKDKNKK